MNNLEINYPFRFIDLSILNDIGQQKLVDSYNELIKQFAKPKPAMSEFGVAIKKLSEYNDRQNIVIEPTINISKLADEAHNVVF